MSHVRPARARVDRTSLHVLSDSVASERTATSNREPLDLLITVLLVAFGLALNHSSVIMGLNLSLADPIAVVLVVVLLLSRRLVIPAVPLVFFLVLSVQQLAVTLYLTQGWSSARLPLSGIGSDYIKLVAVFTCLLIGVQILRMGRTRLVLRAYIVGAVAVSSIAWGSLAVPSLNGVGDLFLGGFRFQGLTNDPNYFAVMTVAALAALWYDPGIRPHLRMLATVVLMGGILLSGSKTGAVTLAMLIIWRLLGMRTARNDSSVDSRARGPALLLVGTILAVLLASGVGLGEFAADVIAGTPSFERIAPLLTDFDAAVVGSGSERSGAWTAAFAVIYFSPLLGVGVGTYPAVAQELVGSPVLAHNTYLQIAAEWGLLLAVVFFAWMARSVIVRPEESRFFPYWATSSTALLVLLIGSIGLSLNNSRLLWVLLGITAAAHMLVPLGSGGPPLAEKQAAPRRVAPLSGRPPSISSVRQSLRWLRRLRYRLGTTRSLPGAS